MKRKTHHNIALLVYPNIAFGDVRWLVFATSVVSKILLKCDLFIARHIAVLCTHGQDYHHHYGCYSHCLRCQLLCLLLLPLLFPLFLYFLHFYSFNGVFSLSICCSPCPSFLILNSPLHHITRDGWNMFPFYPFLILFLLIIFEWLYLNHVALFCYVLFIWSLSPSCIRFHRQEKMNKAGGNQGYCRTQSGKLRVCCAYWCMYLVAVLWSIGTISGSDAMCLQPFALQSFRSKCWKRKRH